MNILKNKSLKPYNTFGIDVKAKYFAEYQSEEELIELLQTEKAKKNKLLAIGGGSNLLFLSDYDGLVLHSKIKGIEVLEETEDDVLLKVGSGVIWDDFVAYCVAKNYQGVENLSLIPGEVGAAAVQNIGAYGMEVKDTIESVSFIEIATRQKQCISNAQCRYSYRRSIFKEELKDKTVIVSVNFRLKKRADFNLAYSHLKEIVEQRGVVSLKNIRKAVIEIRESKLPDPLLLGNAGSFFKNPIIPRCQYEQLLFRYPEMPHYVFSETEVKVPAGWLIEHCDLKGKRFGHVAVYSKQALVLVNIGNATGEEVATVASLIQITVKKKFGIDIEPEVNFI